MKKILFLGMFSILTCNVFSQCSEPKEEPFPKVMNAKFSKNFEECPVIIQAEFLTSSDWKVNSFASKVKDYLKFQSIVVGGDPSSANSGGGERNIFCIDSGSADIVFSLKRGDKIKITGTTYTGKGMYTGDVYFIISKLEKL